MEGVSGFSLTDLYIVLHTNEKQLAPPDKFADAF
jgi:hypothetical protein